MGVSNVYKQSKEEWQSERNYTTGKNGSTGNGSIEKFERDFYRALSNRKPWFL